MTRPGPKKEFAGKLTVNLRLKEIEFLNKWKVINKKPRAKVIRIALNKYKDEVGLTKIDFNKKEVSDDKRISNS